MNAVCNSKVDCAKEVFFDMGNIKFLFRQSEASEVVDNSNVKIWLLDYFTQLMSNRAKSLVTQFGTPPLKYAAIVGQHPLERQRAFDLCLADWKTLLKVESAVAAGGKVQALNHYHWRLNALTRCVP